MGLFSFTGHADNQEGSVSTGFLNSSSSPIISLSICHTLLKVYLHDLSKTDDPDEQKSILTRLEIMLLDVEKTLHVVPIWFSHRPPELPKDVSAIGKRFILVVEKQSAEKRIVEIVHDRTLSFEVRYNNDLESPCLYPAFSR